jgi:hypothetical protein
LQQSKVDASKVANERILADLADALARGLITQADYQRRVVALLQDQGIEYQEAGELLGVAFADGFLANLKDMLKQAQLLVKAGLPGSPFGGDVVDPAKQVRSELADARKKLADDRREFAKKTSAGGTKITAAEQRKLDADAKTVKKLQDLLTAMSRIATVTINIGGVQDPDALLEQLGVLASQVNR